MSDGITTRRATASDLPAAQSWLSDAGLPIEDLTPDHMQDFLLTLVNESPVGMIGLEKFGNVGLLRSLVVDPSVRSAGIGARLGTALESRATAMGVTELWLLTIGADAYFANLGYLVMDRSSAPEVIRGTSEFSSLCPGDAVLMRKSLLERSLDRD